MLISSDSDDDSPDMILKRLERNKMQIRAEQNPSEFNSTIGINIRTAGDDVILVSDTCDNRERISRNVVNNFSTDDVIFVSEATSAKPSTVNDLTKNYDSTDLFLNDPVEIVPTRARGKRKKALDDTVVETRGKRGRGGKKGGSSTPKRGRGRGRRGSSTRTPDTPEISTPFSSIITTILTRGRGRGRGRQRRGATSNSPIGLLPPVPRSTRRQSNRVRTSIPTFSIGNTEEYPDASDHITLFNSVPDKPAINDLDISLDNEEVSVKVLWRSVEVFPFQIRKLQKLTKIFDFFSEREGVPKENLLFMYNNKILSPDDTPESINYSFVKFIDGGITSSGLSLPQAEPTKIKHGFRLKFQCQGTKNPYVVAIGKEEKLQLALIKCAEHLEVPISNLKFEFDGDTVKGNLTAKEMDMESGDCIDVKILNVNK